MKKQTDHSVVWATTGCLKYLTIKRMKADYRDLYLIEKMYLRHYRRLERRVIPVISLTVRNTSSFLASRGGTLLKSSLRGVKR